MGALKALLTLGIPRTYPRVVLGLIARFWFTVNYEYGKDETQFCFMSTCQFSSLCLLSAVHVPLASHRQRDAVRDPRSGQGSPPHALGADGLRRAVHRVTQVPHHHTHCPVSGP